MEGQGQHEVQVHRELQRSVGGDLRSCLATLKPQSGLGQESPQRGHRLPVLGANHGEQVEVCLAFRSSDEGDPGDLVQTSEKGGV